MGEGPWQRMQLEGPEMEIESEDKFLGIILEYLENRGVGMTNTRELAASVDRFMSDKLVPCAVALLNKIKQNGKRDIKRLRRQQKQFERRLSKRWFQPLVGLELFVHQCLSEGNDFNDQFRKKAGRKNDYLFEVLTRLHGRSCQVANEILVLLRGGYADGAHARWRTLHEIAVTGMFIKDKGQSLAQRFLEYEVVENYKEAREYQNNCRMLGYEPLSDEQLNAITERKDEMARKYGEAFLGQYGWAAAILSRQRRSFKAIEDEVSMGHMYSWYKLACNNVHSGPKAIQFRLGLLNNKPQVILAGPTNYGLADPGQSCAISLGQTTVTLLLSRPNYDRVLVSTALQEYADEICVHFVQAQKQLERDERELAHEN